LYQEGRLLGSPDSVSLGKFKEAEPIFEHALTISRELVKADAEDISSRSVLAALAFQLARIRLASDPASALALCDEGFQVRSEIPPANPAHAEKLDLLSDSIRALARLGRQQEASARLERLFRLLKDGNYYPGQVRPGNFAANALRAKAEAAAAAGRNSEALQIWTEMATGFEANTERTKADLHWSVQFSEVYRALASVEASLGDAAGARSWREKDRALWTDWSRKLPGNPFVVRQLATANRP
jgi:tetratricopeptide (TPR) repeat protein